MDKKIKIAMIITVALLLVLVAVGFYTSQALAAPHQGCSPGQEPPCGPPGGSGPPGWVPGPPGWAQKHRHADGCSPGQDPPCGPPGWSGSYGWTPGPPGWSGGQPGSGPYKPMR
jgi:hypothetical protein